MNLVENYSKIELKTCEIKASNLEIAKQLILYYDYLSELINFHSFLESYLICERYYNQTIAKKQFYQSLTERPKTNSVKQTRTVFTAFDAYYPSLRKRVSFRRE